MSSPDIPDESNRPATPPSTDATPNALPKTPMNTKLSTDDVPKTGTPKSDKISTRGIGHKHVQYDPMVVTEMLKRWGQVHYTEFMDRFSQAGSSSAQTVDLTLEQQAAVGRPLDALSDAWMSEKGRIETDMYPILCDSFNRTAHISSSKWVFKDVANLPESNLDDVKIDLAMYPTDIPDAIKAYRPEPPTGSTVAVARREHYARTAWAWMAAAVEVKFDISNTPFHFEQDEGQRFLREGDKATRARAQLIRYASQLMLRQHRKFVFIIYIWRNKARLTRWDRTGCIVSTTIDLLAQPFQLLNFIHRLCCMTPAELGYDETAVLASAEDVQAFEAYTSPNVWAMKYARDATENRIYYPIYRINCLDINGTDSRDYLIGKHMAGSLLPTGRATKGFAAFDMKDKRLRSLKDSWRPNSNKIRPELDVYKHLHKAEVKSITTALGGGDVGGDMVQRTVTQEYLHEVDGSPPPLERLHCRLVVTEIGRPLETYRSSAELMSITIDALEGHLGVWKAGVLHRDISINNILIFIDQDSQEQQTEIKGLLSDWDLCKFIEELSVGPTQYTRAGTWAFMSGLLLEYPLKPNELADDLESFVHVICHCALRFHWTNLILPDLSDMTLKTPLTERELIAINSKNKALAEHVHNAYMSSFQRDHDGFTIGGNFKISQNISGVPGFSTDKSRPLWILITRLYAVLQEHYASVDHTALQEYVGFKQHGSENVPKLPFDRHGLKRKGSLITPFPGNTHPVASLYPTSAATSGAELAAAHADVRPPPPSFPSGVPSGPGTGQNDVSSSNPRLPPVAPRVQYTETIGNRVLDAHTRLMDVFYKAYDLAFDEIDALGGKLQYMDKTKDQFLGLTQYALAGGPSKISSTDSKRSRDTSGSDRALKKARCDSDLGSLQEEGVPHEL